jgi:hypothetical protein
MTQAINRNSFVFFPFLKTSGPVYIGKYQFRSTDDTEDLSPEQFANVKEIANMFFLQDNLQIKSASYSIIPPANNDNLEDLINVQNVVAYIYASPRHEFGDLFLSSGHASIVIITPCQVYESLVYPDFHTNNVIPKPNFTINKRGEIEGYSVRYNFKNLFWVTKGSRIYPPHHITLNKSQDLKNEFESARTGRDDYRLLCKLLNRKNNCMYSRTFTAIKWFNSANNENINSAIKYT